MQRPFRVRPSVEELESRLVPSTYYVATNGNDSAGGGDQTPWRTLQHAANQVGAGDTVIVRAGAYVGFDLSTDGTAAAPIVFDADDGVVINQNNPRTPDGINLEGADYIVIEGFKVTNVGRAGIRSVINHHVTIRDNVLDLNGRWGILTGFSDDLLIENNVASRSQAEHGIYVSNSGDRPVIRDNVIWGNRSNGIHMNGDVSQGGDGIISNALVENNTIYNNGLGGGSGINADGVQNSRFQNNLLYNNHASGMSLYRIDGGASSTGNVVVNNTIVVAADGRWALNIQNASTGNTVYNNILYNHHSFRGSINISADSLPGFTSDYNVVMQRFTTNDGGSVMTLSQWQVATNQDQHSLVATHSQLFVNAAQNNYHLATDSPARDTGTSQQAPSKDLEGHTRPQGGKFDIGAYEFQVELDDLGELRKTHGFRFAGSYYENAYGLGEKWFTDRHGNWFALTSDGSLYQWHGVALQLGTKIAQVDPVVYNDPFLLFNAEVQLTSAERTQLANVQKIHNFEYIGNYWENWGGLREKWFQNSGEQWYFITPAGGVHAWDGGADLTTSPSIATVTPSAYDDPRLLFDAAAVDATTSAKLAELQQAYGFHSTGEYWEDYGGLGEKWFLDQNGAWYFITADGKIRKWNARAELGFSNVIAFVDLAVYDDPTLLFDAA